jgi:predicted AlkP superfamily pyrophosphatase or phosphodiesterase
MRTALNPRRAFALLGVLAGCAGGPRDAGALVQEPAAPRPRLVVMVVVDQLAAHMLDRYADVYTGGFRRLLNGGYRFTQASHAHAATETAPGHATLATGVYPSRHGVIANDWFERRGSVWASVYSFEDTTAAIVGVDWAEGRSPANLLRPGFADWLREADGRSKIASVSRKDRGAIPLAGRVRGEVYWMDVEAGRFVTSRYYRRDLPDWLKAVNERMPMAWADTVWRLEVPVGLQARARPDSAVYEGDGVHVVFPHRLSEERVDTGEVGRNLWLGAVPFADVATLVMARAAVDALELGATERTDYLAVSLSQTDPVGHDYGPTSLEQLDNLLRVDRLLGELLGHLDAEVGEGRWLLALTADHGVMEEPEFRREAGEPGVRFSLDALRALVQGANAAAGTGDLAAGRQRAALRMEENPAVADVMSEEELRSTDAPADSFVELQRRSYHEGRQAGWLGRSGMWVRFAEGTIVNYETGSTHGSPYWYDRHVPLIFYGAGVEAGETAEPVLTVDVAPTLARMIGIAVPEGLDGRPLAVPRR